ncbi:NUDIX hydrolase [Polyangium spumosum]|nr:NUDIX domain-containing protein [Polyangium spumosum]
MATTKHCRSAMATTCALAVHFVVPTPVAYADLKACYLVAYDCRSAVGADILLGRRNVIMRRRGEVVLSQPTVLLNAGQYLVPSGLAEPGETDGAACAIREFLEETGIDMSSYHGELSRSTRTLMDENTKEKHAVHYVRVDDVVALGNAIQVNLDASNTLADELHEVEISPESIAIHFFQPAPPRHHARLGYVMPKWMRDQYDEASRSAWNGHRLDTYLLSPASDWFKMAIEQMPSCP